MSMCWMNGRYIPAEELRISPFDHGFLYGLGFFETFRTYKGKVPFLTEHYNRLCAALTRYNIDMPYSIDQLARVMYQLSKEADGKDGYFRLNVTAGEHDIGLQSSSYEKPNVIIFRKALPARKRGETKIAKWLNIPRNSPEQEVRMKSHHYGNNVLGRFEMNSLVTEEGFFLTSRGFVAEGITSNIFWVTDGVLYTPSIETGILPGITRECVIQLARQLDIRVEQGFFTPRDLRDAFECFVTNSVQELVPISQIGTDRYLGSEGPVYNRLHQAYVEEILSRLKGR